MPSLNNCQFIGNVGKDAELRYTASGTAQAQFSVAVNYKSGDKDVTEWVNCVLWSDLAEKLSQYLVKGTLVYVSGRLQTRSWDDDGGVKHYRTEVVLFQVQLLSRKEGGNQQGGGWSDSPPAQAGRGRQQQSAPASGSARSRSQTAPFGEGDEVGDLPF